MLNHIKPIAILVEEQYQVLEVWYPLLRLHEAQIPVVTVGSGSRGLSEQRGISGQG